MTVKRNEKSEKARLISFKCLSKFVFEAEFISLNEELLPSNMAMHNAVLVEYGYVAADHR